MELNSFLKVIENYLLDLSIMDKSNILTELSQELYNKDLIDLNPLEVANNKRISHGHKLYIDKQKPSFGRFLIKAFLVMLSIFIIFISFLIWKFTPLMKIDEKNNRVIILGGLIDIDAKAGKFKIMQDYHFTEAQYKNDFQASIPLDPNMKSIAIDFSSGLFTIKTAKDNLLNIDCKLSTPPHVDMIDQTVDQIKISFKDINGSCEVEIPKDLELTIEAETAHITLVNPEFHTDLNLNTGNIDLDINPEIKYQYNLKVKNGNYPRHLSSKNNSGYKMNLKLGTGNILEQSL
jgi:hypothetical protein